MKFEEIGLSLKHIRKSKRYTLMQAENLSSYSAQQISRMENHNTKMSLASVCALLDVYGYEIEFVPKDRKEVVSDHAV